MNAMITRSQYEAIENEMLAPYASKCMFSKGRAFPEEEHPVRTAFQRDRDRVIHSRAFRRLEYKTQVFVNHEGDHYRTRLTHTMEVAQIGRNIARALRLNEDLTEAITLAHDVGHPPFGHSGEKALNKLMANNGGFEHNRQSIRIVEKIEKRYPDFDGLNLTWEVRKGLQKHLGNVSSLEAQTADIADDIAYLCHDLDDGLSSGLLFEKDLEQLSLWRNIHMKIRERYPNAEPEVLHSYTVRSLIDYLVTSLLDESAKRIREQNIEHI
ncbi:MAG: dNTP triphosphohydrolase, partial [Chlamydiota bacterium]|nr:dNTP triphosphohydrolase [Chlamydiota bacterium]